jgi:hypothetical protein
MLSVRAVYVLKPLQLAVELLYRSVVPAVSCLPDFRPSRSSRMGQARFIECGEILQSDFAKGFSMKRFVPVLAGNGERLFVTALEKQGVGEVVLDEDQVVAVTFLDPVADLISQTLSLFAPCLCLRELAIQDQVEGKTAERRRQPVLTDRRVDRTSRPEAIPPIPVAVSGPLLLPNDCQASKAQGPDCPGSRPNPEADRPWS